MPMLAPSLDDLLEGLVRDTAMFGPTGPCPITVEPGPRRDLMLITGDNASGKSFVCKVMQEAAQPDRTVPVEERRGLEFMRVGMNLRAGGSPMQRMMFGDEGRNSTGTISVRTIETGFRTSAERTHPHILCLDEPDIGLSEDYQHACGRMIAEFAATPAPHLVGLIVVTHSRPIARVIRELGPTALRLGSDAGSTGDWLDRPRPVTIESLRQLTDVARKRSQAINALMERRKHDSR